MNKILLLEDEENLNRGITFFLQKEGYYVYSCFSVREVESVLRRDNPQVFLCDITLPDGNGLDFIRKIRKDSNAHIICLTALDQETDQIMGYEAGVDDYITKPFSLSVLTLKLGAYFKKKDVSNSYLVKSGDLRINQKEMKVWKDDLEISFTKNEWKMLQLFIEHPKLILSKTQLLEMLFDSEQRFVDENTLAVNIKRLREKIEKDISEPEYIKNIRGIGYVWNKECIKLVT